MLIQKAVSLPAIMKGVYFISILLVMLIAILATSLTSANYKERQCPKMCRCLKFEGLWSVYCNYSSLNAVPTGIPTNTQLLDLSSNSIQKIPRSALQNLANLQQIYLSANGFNEESFEPGALELSQLAYVYLDDNAFTSIPSTLPSNLTELFMYANHITVLKSDSFTRYPKLQYIDVTQNGLREIEEGTLDPLPELTSFGVPFNKLNDSRFPAHLFSKNLKLGEIRVRFNSFTSVFKNLPPSITYCDYVGNQIKTILSFAFSKTPNIQTMEFWEGQVTTIEDNAFYGLAKVTILDFMQDKISSTLTNNTLSGLTGLKNMYLDLNNISRIETGAFRDLASISSLWMASNQLTSLEPQTLNTKYIPNLRTLYIDSNPWYCDCHLRWLREKVNNATYVIQDTGLITCAGPSQVAGKSWDDLQPRDFVCPI